MMVCSMVSLPRPDDILSGKYRLEKVIGRGGMGVVMAAWHLELDQRVALKFLLPELAEHQEAAERFRREARASAKIKSEHVARVLDVGTLDGGVPFMVMEHLDGRDLALEHRERGPLPVQDVIDYVLQAIEAVAEAHSLGIVHRDLKPENLFLSKRPDGTRCIKVLDFGISKSIVLGSEGRALTHTAIIMGSPFYMSPEQMRAPRSVDARTDIWSIGAILYDLIAGRPPYVAETIPQLCTMMLEGDPPPLGSLRTDLNPQLERVISRCLVRDVAKRWMSVGDLAVALLPFASRGSRLHVERAGRVLSAMSRESPSLLPPPSSIPDSAERAVSDSFHPSRDETPTGARAESSLPLPAGSAPLRSAIPNTQKTWENSRARSRRPSGPGEGSSPRWVPIAAVGALIFVGGGAWWMLSRKDTAPAPAPISSASVLVSPVTAGAPENAEAPPAVEPVASGAASASAPAASSSAFAASLSATLAAAPVAAKPAVAIEAPRPVERAQPPRLAPERTAPPAATGLTDFGGRR
jgi:serine/threonine protein kinase